MTGTFDVDKNQWISGADTWILSNIHPVSADCYIYGCMIHFPSYWPGSDWPYVPREDGVRWERTCPHGIGHPDPDNASYWQRAKGWTWVWTHGCDGCCGEGEPFMTEAVEF